MLPKADDVARIATLTSNGYSSSTLTAPGLQTLPPAVGKILREANITIRSAQPAMGFVRFRTPRCPSRCLAFKLDIGGGGKRRPATLASN